MGSSGASSSNDAKLDTKPDAKSDVKVDAKPVAEPAPAPKAAKKDEDSEEEEDEDEMAEMPVMAAPTRKTGPSRRVSVSAESMDPNKLKQQMAQVTCIEKSPEVTAELMRVVGKSPLLRTLDAEQKDKIVKAFSGPLIKEPGDNIIVQGEIGDVFYLVEDGLVDVYIKKGDSDEIKVHTYKSGDAFGELAIMYNAPRAATCRAQTTTKLWALDRVSFKVIVVAAAMLKRETYSGFLKNVPILETLNEMEVMALADSLAEETFDSGATVCQQGDEGNYFYIIKSGSVTCSVCDAAGESKTVATLTTGAYFGEIALLTSKPRQATVKADGPLVVLSLDRATFVRVFGALEDIMKRSMEQYNKYAAAGI